MAVYRRTIILILRINEFCIPHRKVVIAKVSTNYCENYFLEIQAEKRMFCFETQEASKHEIEIASVRNQKLHLNEFNFC